MIFLFILTTFLASFSAPKSWAPLTDSKRKWCESAKPCSISQSKHKVKFSVTAKTDIKDKMRWLKSFTISAQGKKKTYEKLQNYQGHHLSEKLNLFSTDINRDGYVDLAAEASRHIGDGYQYFYFIYNPKKKEFVLTEEHLPALYSPAKGKLQAIFSKLPYKLTKDYKIVAVKTKKKKAKSKKK